MSAQPARLPSPLPEDKLALLTRLTDGLDSDALQWVSGYIAGTAAAQRRAPLLGTQLAPIAAPSVTAIVAEPAAQTRLTVVYGSQTGNAKRQAEAIVQQAEAAGLAVRLVRADTYATRELANERLLYVVISTQGDGDPPDDSRAFVEFLAGKRAPKLPQLKFAVLGLGDSSYPQFCAIGAKIDTRLAELGATRLLARGDADLDVATIAAPWAKQALEQARETLKSEPSGVQLATVTPLRAAAQPTVPAAAWTREKPFLAPLLANQRISARNGSKDIRHIELSLEGSQLAYEPGDSLGVWATNPAWLVDELLAALKLDGERVVALQDETTSLREWLLRKREITQLSKPFITAHAQRAQHTELDRALGVDGKDALRRLLGDYQLIDLVRQFPARWQAEDFIAALRPLAPRMYSIASSRRAVGDEAHLTVAVLDYEAFGTRHVGTASNFLATLAEDASVPVFIEANERFRLPADPSRDVVMIGPGTGVAPFRGFVQERAETRSPSSGRNWLFFGNPHFRSDFLYQLEWQQALKAGTLQRLDLAFSRDQSEKIYVQHTLRRRGRELYDWIQNGAHLYVCGDATRMAADVDAALREIVIEHGGRSEEEARDFLNELAADRRYSRDVY